MTSGTAHPKPKDMASDNPTGFKSAFSNAIPLIRDFFVHSIFQIRIYKKIYPGIMHALIFWGVMTQILGTAVNLMQMQLFIPFVELPFPRGNLYLAFELVMDLAGAAILIGVAMAALRRVILRPKTLESQWDDYFGLIILTLIPIMGFTLEGVRLLSVEPQWLQWSPIGSLFAFFLKSINVTPQTAASLHPFLFWTHVSLGLIFAASIPFTKLRHLFLVPLNIIKHPRRKEGVLDFIDNIEETELLGVGKVTEFTSEQLLAFDACVRCGRCEEVCPASISGMSYSPRTLIQSLREEMVSSLVVSDGNKPAELIGKTIQEETPWACTTCGACLQKCPTFVDPVDEIIDLRRYLTLTTGKLPKSIADTLRNMERQGNPWGMPPQDRTAWTNGLGIRELAPGESTDVLLFLGCAFAYDERNKKVAKSFVNLLQKADVDFATLGMDEGCCGETARRMGHEYLFQVFAEQNIETLSNVNFNKLVTQCPHCFNTLKNEYPQMDADFPVQHYSEFLSDLVTQTDKIQFLGEDLTGKITYHDPCYLGRYNDIYQAPRQLLDLVNTEKVEMSPREENSFCCGGGGGQMWLETDAETRINHRRLNDAMSTEAEYIATSCPYCLLMFDDAIRSKGVGQEVQVLDIAELLDHNNNS